MDSFIHLHTHSAYSLAEGAMHPKDIVKLCVKHGMPALAVTDTNNMFGAMEFAMAAAGAGVQPIVGVQLALEGGKQVVLLVQSDAGYRHLCQIISDAYMAGDGTKDVSASFATLEGKTGGLICLSGGPVKGLIDEADILKAQNLFGDRFYIELQRHGLPEEDRNEGPLIDLAYQHNIPLVATNDVYFSNPTMHEAHDALLCISEGRYVTEEDRRKATPDHCFKSAKEMEALFADLPEAVLNTSVIARRCHFLLVPIDPILPPFETEKGSEVEELLAQAKEGLQWRLDNYVPEGADKQAYWDRLEFELKTIEDMGFPGYFLIVSDFIKWAKDHDIPVGPGRGSGGGSVVAWALKITDLDPLALNLLFERFLNPERVSMPDFDIDFCQNRRDEVIRYVQERYGYDRVAQIITFGKLQARAVVRDVGRVLQMPYGAVDRIAKMIPNNPANPVTLGEALEQDPDLRAEADKDDTTRKLVDIALKLEGLYRHASTHAAGVVIGDRPLHQLVPLYRDPRSDMPVTQFNMKYVEQAGLVKFDFLGLKTMTVIHKAVEFIKESTGHEINILEVPFDDVKTFEMLCAGRNTGVFQVESAGMRDLGKQIKLSNLEELLAVIALYRPGPMENIPVYLENVKNPANIDYMHPKLRPITEDTYGVMIYQEQVMQAAQVLAGYTLGGADLLRRAMGKKIKEEMDQQREMFVQGAKEHNDVSEDQANHIFDQIAKFAGYGFNKAHTAGYGLVSYWTAWLKANYPVEFMAASMTLDYGNTDKLAVFKQELDRMGIRLLIPDINLSQPLFKVEEGAVRYALAALKGVGEGAMEKLVAERQENGPYKSLPDFIERLDAKSMNKKQFEMLVCAGAFDAFYPNRAELYGNIEMLLRHAHAQAEERASGQVSLFGGGDDGEAADLPPFIAQKDWDILERLRYEFDAVGFYLSAHPLDTKAGQLGKQGIVSFTDLQETLRYKTSSRIQMAGILIKKQERVSAKSGNKFAFLQLSDSTGVFEVMIFSDTLARCRPFLEPGTALLVTVDAEMRDDQARLTGQALEPLEDALTGKLKELHIHLDAPAPAAKLRELLDIEGRGRVRVTLMAHVPDGKVAEIPVPGGWSISPAAIAAVRQCPGVVNIIEG